jgi:hypothetical protein
MLHAGGQQKVPAVDGWFGGLIEVGVVGCAATKSVGVGGFQLGKHEVVNCLLGEAGEASGLVDVAFGCRDRGVTKCGLHIADIDCVRGKCDCRERVSQGMGRVVGQADRVKSLAYDA